MYKKSNKNPLVFLAGLSIILSSLVLGFIGSFVPKVLAESSSSIDNISSSSLSSDSSSSSVSNSLSSSYISSPSSSSSQQQNCKWAVTVFGYTYYVVVPCGTPLSISTDGPIPISSSSSYSSSSSQDSSSLYSSSSSSYPHSSYSSVIYSEPSSSSSSLSSNSNSSSNSSSTYSSSLSSSLLSSSYSSVSSFPSSVSSSLSSLISSSSHSVPTGCPVVINNSDFYYKGGNVSVSNYGPSAINNVAIKIILPNGANVSSSSGTSYIQTGNILRFYIPTIGAYTNIDTSYIHDYLGFYPVTTTIECNQSKPISSNQYFKEQGLVD